MSKFFKRIAKDSVKFTADFEAIELSFISEEDTYIRLDIQRGKQKPSSLAPMLVRSSGMGRDLQRIRFPANKTQLACTFFIKNGEPEVKTAKISVYICDRSGKGTFLASSAEVNLARHFGDSFKNGLLTLQATSGAQARGFSFQSLSYSTGLEAKKAKHAAAVTEMVQWREQVQVKEERQAAQQVDDLREEEVRREAHRVDRERQAATQNDQQQQQIRGFASFKESNQARPQQKRTQSMLENSQVNDGQQFPNPSSGSQQRTQSVVAAPPKKKSAGVVFNKATAATMMSKITELEDDQETQQSRHSAVRNDVRASNRSAVKGDLRNSNNLGFLETTHEEGMGDGQDSDDQFDHLLNKGVAIEIESEADRSAAREDDTKMKKAAELAALAKLKDEERSRKEEEAAQAELALKESLITDLEQQITAMQQELSKKAQAEGRKHEMTEQLEQLEAEHQKERHEAEYALQMQNEEQHAILEEIERLKANQESDMEMQVLKAHNEVEMARDELNEEEVQRKLLTQQFMEKQEEFEDDSNAHSQHGSEIGQLYAVQQELTAELEETMKARHSRQEQIHATEALIGSMEVETERNIAMIIEVEEKQGIVVGQQIAELRANTTHLRKERGEMEREKLNMQHEAAEMKEMVTKLEEKTILDEQQLEELNEKVEHTEKEITKAKDEKAEFEDIIAAQAAYQIKREKEKLQLKRFKTQMMNKKAERKKKEELKQQKLKEEREKAELEAQIEAERLLASEAMHHQFQKANESMFSDALDESQVLSDVHSSQAGDESIILHDRSLLMAGMEGQMTPRNNDGQFFKENTKKRQSIFQPNNNLSFYSEGREDGQQDGSFQSQQSFVSQMSEDADPTNQSFDQLMREKANRNGNDVSFKSGASEQKSNHDISFVEHNDSYRFSDYAPSSRHQVVDQNDKAATVVFSTPKNETNVHFESAEAEVIPLQTEQPVYKADDSLSDKSLTEPAIDSMGYEFSESQKKHTSMKKKVDHDESADWLKYQEQESEGPLTLKPDQEHKAEVEDKDADILVGVDKLSNADSGYDSFHSEDIDDKPESKEMQDLTAAVAAGSDLQRQYTLADSKKDWKKQSALTMIRENRAESVMTGMDSGSDDDIQMVRVESPRSDSSEHKPKLTESLIHQKVLRATSPSSKARVNEELKEDLVTINGEIVQIQPNEPILEEKYRIRDLIESSIESLEHREKKQAYLSMKNLAAVEAMSEEVDPYAPSTTSGTGAYQTRDNRSSLLDRSRFSSFSSSSRGSVRGSVYRSTAYDRQRSASLKSKSRRQVFTEMAMRDMIFMLVTSRTFFSAMSDFELMTGFNQFKSMLTMDTKCHEAMYGLGKVNFFVKRYELAERWFMSAYKTKKDKMYRAWLGFTYMKLSSQVMPDSPNRMPYLKYAVKNLTACVKDDDLATYCIMALLFLSVDLQKEIPNQPDVPGLKEPSKYLQGLKTCYEMKSGDNFVELTLAQAYIDLNTPGSISKGVSALNQCIAVSPSRPEPYLMLSQHHANLKQVFEEKRVLGQAIKKANDFQSYPERLLLILTHAKNLRISSNAKDHLEACQLLQLQYTRTPHYAGAILYAYGKTIVKCELNALLPSAISALEEAQRCSTSLRVQSCYAYLAKAFNLLNLYPMHASLYALQYQSSSKELTDRISSVKVPAKTKMVAEILASQPSSHQTMFDVLSAVKAAVQFDQITAVERGSHVLTMSFIQGSRSSVRQIGGVTVQKMNMLATPLERLVEKDDSASMASGSIEDLVKLTKTLPEQRDQLISQGLILRSLQDNSNEAHNQLFSKLQLQRDEIIEQQDVQLQTLKVRCFRKAKLYQASHAGKESLTTAFALINMVQHVKNKQSDAGGSPPLTTVVYVDAHIETAKLLFALSKLGTEVEGLSSDTLFQLALLVLLAAIPVMSQVDFNLANPQLPVEVDEYGFQDLEMIDFTLDTDMLSFAQELEQTSQNVSSGQSFCQSALVQTKILADQLMLQGMIPVDAHQSPSEVDEEQAAVFSFPENLHLRQGENSWSATSRAAINMFLESEGTISADTSNDLNTKVIQLCSFHVHSGPELLQTIGKMCLKAGKFADLAVVALKEYLVAVTYQKMFTMAAGQALDDQASVQSGYSLIRHKTMLLLAQSLQQLATEAEGERKNQIMQDGQALLAKVSKGRHTTDLKSLITVLKKTLK